MKTLFSQIEGFILTGGASHRMGKSKYKLQIGGKTFVELAASALDATSTGQINIVGDIDERYLKVKLSDGLNRLLRNIPDIAIEISENNPASGAMIGLYTGFDKFKDKMDIDPCVRSSACDRRFDETDCELLLE